jgi:hypothetical protein
VRSCLILVALLAGCGTAPDNQQPPEPTSVTTPAGAASTPAPTPTGASPPSATGNFMASAEAIRSTATKPPRKPSPGNSPSKRPSTGWEITVYYTAVERFHHGDPTTVTGCSKLNCSHGDDDLGSYPDDFVDAVREEGTGRTARGRYLNWSYDVGFWLDAAPRSSDGDVLKPFVSAAADPDVLPQGTRFTIANCGRQDDGSAPRKQVCTALRKAAWRITDEFTPGLGGARHIDAYIGPETGPGFTDSDWYITTTGARLEIG